MAHVDALSRTPVQDDIEKSAEEIVEAPLRTINSNSNEEKVTLYKYCDKLLKQKRSILLKTEYERSNIEKNDVAGYKLHLEVLYKQIDRLSL